MDTVPPAKLFAKVWKERVRMGAEAAQSVAVPRGSIESAAAGSAGKDAARQKDAKWGSRPDMESGKDVRWVDKMNSDSAAMDLRMGDYPVKASESMAL